MKAKARPRPGNPGRPPADLVPWAPGGPLSPTSPDAAGAPEEGTRLGDGVVQGAVDGSVRGTHRGESAWFVPCAFHGEARRRWRQDAERLVGWFGVREVVEQDGWLGAWISAPNGRPLSQLDERSRLPLGDVGQLGDALLEAVEAVHERGAHVGGLTPALVFLDGPRLRLLVPAPYPATDAPVAPPETWSGVEPDRHADVHVVGTLLYHLATGRGPFSGDAEAIRAQVRSGRVRRARERRPDLPEHRDRAIAAALEPDRDHRPPDCRHLAGMWRGDLGAWEQPSGLLMLRETPPAALTAPPPPVREELPEAPAAPDAPTVQAAGNAPETPVTAGRGGPVPLATPAANRPITLPPPEEAAPAGRSRWPLVVGVGVVAVLLLGAVGAALSIGIGGGAAVVATTAVQDRPGSPRPGSSAPPPPIDTEAIGAAAIGAEAIGAAAAPTAGADRLAEAPAVVASEPEPAPPGGDDPVPAGRARPRPGEDGSAAVVAAEPAAGLTAEPAAEPAMVEPEPAEPPAPAPEPDAAPDAAAAVEAPASAPEPAPAPAPEVAAPTPSGPPVVHRSEVTFKLSPKAVYPDGQRDAGDVTCLATVVIDAKGLPQSVSVSRCPDAFAEPTRAAMMKARFLPPKVNGESSAVTTTIPVKFSR